MVIKMLNVGRKYGCPEYTFNYGLSYNEQDGSYVWKSVALPIAMTYESVTSAIINNEYSADSMQAIINNYLLDPAEPSIRKEWLDMQAFRAFAKKSAKDILSGTINESSVLSLE